MDYGIQRSLERNPRDQKMAEHIGRCSEILAGHQTPESRNSKQEGSSQSA